MDGRTVAERVPTGTLGGRHFRARHFELHLLRREHHANGPEVLSVERRDAELPERLAMIDRGITAVVLPAVSGVLRGELRHEPVARDFRDDGCGGDREGLGVAPDDLAVLPWRERGIED